MNTNLDASVNFEDPKLQEYIYDEKETDTLKLEPVSESGFTNEPQDRRLNNFFPTYSQEIPFMVTEEWAVEEIILDSNGNQTGSIQSGINLVDVVLGQKIKVNAEYWVYFKNGVSQEAKVYGRSLLKSFDPQQHGDDLNAWIKANLNDVLKEDMFSIETCIHIDKNGSRQELNIDQRIALLTLFGEANGNARGNINVINGEGEYSQWTESKNLKIRKVGESIKTDQSAPPITRNVREVEPPQQSEDVVNDIIDEITRVLVPSQCGKMRRQQHRLLDLFEWPEFKIEWKKIRIKIGCSKITISVPVLRVRISRIVFYVHYSLPVHIDRFVFKIAETCAIRSALGAAIIGIIMSNPASAFASFNALFKRCLEQEIKNCVNSGLLTIKETGKWK